MLNSGDADLLTIEAALAHFGLGAAMAVSPTQLGMANRSFHVITADGNRYVVKFLVHQMQSLLINELAVQQQLQDHGIVTPRYIRSPSGEYVYRPAAVPELAAVISTAIGGVHPETVSQGLAYAMGAMLAHYHAAVCSLPVAHAGWLNRGTVAQAAAETTNSAVKDAALALIAQGEPIFGPDLPCGIIHGDFHIGNLLVTSRTSAKIAAMLDFEEAEENLLLIDIAFGLFGSHSLAYTTRRTHKILHAFLDGYESVRTLEPMEKANLAAAISYVAGACSLWMYAHGYEDNAAHNLAIADALRKIDLIR
jgi:Ser/Thr protein kinase RdoA (MazF antagonist)